MYKLPCASTESPFSISTQISEEDSLIGTFSDKFPRWQGKLLTHYWDDTKVQTSCVCACVRVCVISLKLKFSFLSLWCFIFVAFMSASPTRLKKSWGQDNIMVYYFFLPSSLSSSLSGSPQLMHPQFLAYNSKEQILDVIFPVRL